MEGNCSEAAQNRFQLHFSEFLIEDERKLAEAVQSRFSEILY